MNIGIFGSSWAVSSYKALPNYKEEMDAVTFQTLFESTQFRVFNHALQGSTNLNTLRQIKKNPHYDFYIVFQTDPIKQCLDNDLRPISDLELPVCDNLIELCELLLKDFYNELEKISAPVLLIGADTKLCFKHIPPKIHTLEKSWTELMQPDFTDNYFIWVEPTLSLFNHARKILGWQCNLADFFEYEKQIMAKQHLWQTSDDFSWVHAATPAYKKMFDKILEKLHDTSSKTRD